jgi:hypothetical protein
MFFQLGEEGNSPFGGMMLLRANGREYDLLAPGGSDEFMEDDLEFFMENILEKVRQARADSSEGAGERTALIGTPGPVYPYYQLLTVVVSQASLEVFREISIEQLQVLLEEMIMVFTDAAAAPEYAENGQITLAEKQLMDVLCCCLKHANFVHLLTVDHEEAIDIAPSLLQVLADLLNAGPDNYKTSVVGECMMRFVRNMICFFHRHWDLDPEINCPRCPCKDTSAVFEMLDDSGIFCPLLRHMANPQVYIESATILEFLDQDHTCVFIRDNLKVGTRCGNVLREMNARHDAFGTGCERVKVYFDRIEKIAMEMNHQSTYCRVCSATKEDKNLSTLLMCGRCKGEFETIIRFLCTAWI